MNPSSPSEFRRWLRNIATTAAVGYRNYATDLTPDAETVALNSCIETTRLLVDALTLLGVKARPVPVDVIAGNHLATAAILNGRPITPEDEAAGAWTVGMHHQVKGNGGGWDGHLVTVVTNPATEGGRVLIDLTADQFARPQHGILAAPIIFGTIPPGRPWTPRDPFTTALDPAADGTRGFIRYTPMPPGHPVATAWRTSGAWNSQAVITAARDLADTAPPTPAA